MPKRRRLLNTISSAEKNKHIKQEPRDEEVWNARGRLKGALQDVLEPAESESDASSEDGGSRHSRAKRDINADLENGHRDRDGSSSPPRQSYVLKLFDRSVDLSQFKEDSPLYPVCRAWILNQPKAIYSELGSKDEVYLDEGVHLPAPLGEPISRVPELLPEQMAASKDNINLDYKERPPPLREELLAEHLQRWGGVRDAWLRQAQLCETRYANTQELLNKLHVSSM